MTFVFINVLLYNKVVAYKRIYHVVFVSNGEQKKKKENTFCFEKKIKSVLSKEKRET